MSLSDLSAADVALLSGRNNNDGFGGDGLYGIIVLFILLGMMNNGGFGWGGGGQQVNADLQRGFDQSALSGAVNGVQQSVNGVSSQLCNGFAGVNQTVSNGFATAEVADNARQIAAMQQAFATQTDIGNRLDSIVSSLQNCCCENRQNIADLKYTVATENCQDRQALSDGIRDILAATNQQTQTILTQMCNDKIDSKNEQIVNLQRELSLASLRESQTAQTSALMANNAMQTQLLEQLIQGQTAAGRSGNGTSS